MALTESPPPILTAMISADLAWHGPALPASRYVLPIPTDCLAELDGVVAELRQAPVPTPLAARVIAASSAAEEGTS